VVWPQLARKNVIAMSDKAKSRTVQADGDAIRRLRRSQGWNVEDLAKQAKCSVKTVENIDKSANVYLFTLAKFAQALGVEPKDLMPASADAPLPVAEATRIPNATQISFTINMHFSSLDETRWLADYLEEIVRRAGVMGQIDVRSIREGASIVVELASSTEDAYRIAYALVESKLSGLNAVRVRMPANPYIAIAQQHRADIWQHWRSMAGTPRETAYTGYLANNLRQWRAESEGRQVAYPYDFESFAAARLFYHLLTIGEDFGGITLVTDADGSFTIEHPDARKPESTPVLEGFPEEPDADIESQETTPDNPSQNQ
jgi:transcriptional regulator with XRE-family HTH domain